MTRTVIYLIMILVLCEKNIIAQDIHFSQFSHSPAILNPGATGSFEGKMRAALNYRNQWTTIGSNYQTYSASYEMIVLKNKQGGNYLGGGLNIFSDKAGAGGLKKTLFNLSVAYNAKLNEQHSLSMGLQGGYVQRALDETSLTWDEQYDGNQYVATLPSGESIKANVNYIDASAGLLWKYSINNTADVHAGAGVFHVNQPNQSFTGAGDKLPMKIVAHARGRFTQRKSELAFIPNLMVAMQGPGKEINAGILMRYLLRESSKYTGFIKGNAVYFGANYRVGDAAIIVLGLEISDWYLGISYDVNVSGFNKATSGVGGFELSLIFVKPD